MLSNLTLLNAWPWCLWARSLFHAVRCEWQARRALRRLWARLVTACIAPSLLVGLAGASSSAFDLTDAVFAVLNLALLAAIALQLARGLPGGQPAR